MSMQSRPPPPGVDSTESVEVFYDSVDSHSISRETDEVTLERDSGYEDNQQDLDSDMESRPRIKRTKMGIVPAIPQRNERRASRVLDNLLLDLTSLDGTREKERTSIVVQEDPHELYLSSEEDASLSDDYEDSETEFDMEDSTIVEGQAVIRPSSRKSQEDTARVVSFMMVGKPQIVEINLHSPTSSPKRQSLANTLAPTNNTSTLKRTSKRPSPLKLFPEHDERRISTVSMISTATASTAISRHSPADYSTSYIAYKPQTAPLEQVSTSNIHPSRKSSRLAANLSSLKSSLQNHARSDDAHRLGLHTNPTASYSAFPSQPVQQHAFLNMDPFEAEHRTSNDEATPQTPKTPTGMSSAAWRMMSGKSKDAVSRTLSKARKSSMGKLNLAYTAGALQPRYHENHSRTSLAINTSVEQQTDGNYSRYSEEEQPSRLQRRSATMPMQFMNNETRRPSTSSSNASRGESGRGKYEDMLRRAVAKTNVQSQPESPISKGSTTLRRMTLGRKKSVKA